MYQVPKPKESVLEKLLAPAHHILEQNWKDGFTIPTSKLYPFQWNWDSGFITLGHYYKDPKRAIQELTSLFSGQWENGLLPHIIFHSETEKTYFPNYDFWKANVNAGAPLRPAIGRLQSLFGADRAIQKQSGAVFPRCELHFGSFYF